MCEISFGNAIAGISLLRQDVKGIARNMLEGGK